MGTILKVRDATEHSSLSLKITPLIVPCDLAFDNFVYFGLSTGKHD